MRELVLASTSTWRKAVLENAGIRVRCEGPGVDERAVCETDPVHLARTLARSKADAVARRMPHAWVIGADQVVTDGVRAWGKPADAADHVRQLTSMRGRSHDLVTAFCIVGPGIDVAGDERTTMWFRGDVTDGEIAAYVATGEGSGCAGGYAAEGRGVFLIEQIAGDWFNVLGLPLMKVMTALRVHGWRFGEQP